MQRETSELKKYINESEYETQIQKDRVDLLHNDNTDIQKKLNTTNYEFDILRHKIERSNLTHNEITYEFTRYENFVSEIKEELYKKDK